jgi:hypothetical protein
MRFALRTGKALWFALVDSRVFLGLLKVWCFPRIVSAIAGSLTVGSAYFFAKRFFNSVPLGLLSAAVLAILPSHVFYSRLAFQEALCTFFFIWAVYFYLYPREFGRRTFVSVLFFVCVYFTNYRLIIAPVLVGFIELYMSWTLKKPIQYRKYFGHILMFFFAVFMIGAIDKGGNTITTFSWMFYQANMADGKFEWVNFLSYPYYIFRLDSWFAGAFFFANIIFLIRREWNKALPFLLVCLMMGVFSLPYEKGARYLCVGLPFLAMAVARFAYFMCCESKWKKIDWIGPGIIAVLLLTFLPKTFAIAQAHSDYQKSIELVKKNDPFGKGRILCVVNLNGKK